MAKAFYAVQKHTNTLMKWNGAWSALDAPAGTVPAANLRHGQIFEFQGKLRMFYVDTVALKVATWDVSSQLWANETIIHNGSSIYLISNAIIYKGKLVFMGKNALDGSNVFPMYTWDGTTAVEVLDAGLAILQPNMSSSFNIWPDTLCPVIFPHRHQLIYAMAGVWRDTSAGVIGCSHIYRLDTQAAAGQSGAQWLFGPRVGGTLDIDTYISNGSGHRMNSTEMNASKANLFLTHMMVGLGTWRDRLFLLRYDGWVCELNAASGGVTRHFDFRDHPGLAVTGQSRVSTSDPIATGGGEAYLAIGDSGIDASKLRGFPLGARVDVGGTKYSVGAQLQAATDYIGLVDADGNVLDNQPAGTAYTIETKGLVPTQVFYTPHGGYLVAVRMVEVGNFLYIIYGAREPSLAVSDEEKNGLLITKWDVVNDVKTHFTVLHPITAAKPNISSLNVDFDPETGRIMIMWADSAPTPDSWYYVAWDTGTDTVENDDDFFAFGGSDADSVYAQGPQALLAFVEGQPGVAIDSVSYDETNAKTTIGYTIFNPGDEVVDVTIEFSRGNGVWTPCTRKDAEGEGLVDLAAAEAGTAHTFVHDLIADAPGFQGKVQYRVKVAE